MTITDFNPRLRKIRVRCTVEKILSTHIGVSNDNLSLPFPDLPPKLFWLPRSEVKVNRDGTVAMTVQLAKEVGLV